MFMHFNYLKPIYEYLHTWTGILVSFALLSSTPLSLLLENYPINHLIKNFLFTFIMLLVIPSYFHVSFCIKTIGKSKLLIIKVD